MKLLADENIPKHTIMFLKERGFDIISVSQMFPGCTDEEIIKIANTDGRIVITFDLDFGDYLFHRGLEIKTGVILFRLKPVNPYIISDAILEILDKDITFEGYLTIVKEDNIRQRPLLMRDKGN